MNVVWLVKEKRGGKWARKRVNALEQPEDEKVRAQAHDGKLWRSTAAPQFLPFQGYFGNSDPIQIAPKLSATVT